MTRQTDAETAWTGRVSRRRLMRGALGAAATVTTLSAFSGVAAAHFPVELDIDVRPGSEKNRIGVDGDEHVRVAVFRSEFIDGDGRRATFDPTTRAVRYRFGAHEALDEGKGAEPVDEGTVETIQGHGGEREALVLRFPVDETGFDGEDTVGWLYWDRDESREPGYAGVDGVTIVGADGEAAALLSSLLRLLSRLLSGQ